METNFTDNEEVNLITPHSQKATGFDMAKKDREIHRWFKWELPSQEKQIEYIFLTIRKQEKRLRDALIFKWTLRFIIIFSLYFIYQNKEFIIREYILPEINSYVSSVIEDTKSWILNNSQIDGVLNTFSSWSINKMKNKININEEDKNVIIKKMKETIDFYKSVIEW